MRKEIDVEILETMWLYHGHDAVNVQNKDQAKKLIEDIRNAAKELGWEV